MREATLDIPEYKEGSEIYVGRFWLINRAIQTIVGQFYDLLSQSYMAETIATPSSTGKYYSSGASYDADTDTLTATMNANFASTDIGNLIIFREADSVYVGTILSVPSTTSVILMGDNLPSADIATVNDVIMAATTPTSDSISLASLPMMRTGQQIKLEVESTVTDTVQYESTIGLKIWRTTLPGNTKAIAIAFAGSTLYMKKGSLLDSYGTLTIRYPKIPDDVSTDATYIDVPDGITVQLVIAYLRTLILNRLNVRRTDDSSQIEMLIAKMYQTFGQEASAEILKSKMMAFK